LAEPHHEKTEEHDADGYEEEIVVEDVVGGVGVLDGG
jgi:hypothetical protein